MRRVVAAAAYVSFSALGSTAFATPVTIHFSGDITERIMVTSDPFNGAIDVSTPFSGTFRFHTDAPNQGNADVGIYIENDPISGIDVRVGHFSGRSSTAVVPLNYRIFNDSATVPIGDTEDIQTQGMVFGGVDSYLVQIFLNDPTGTALSSVALSKTPPDLNALGQGTFVVGLGPRTGGGANARRFSLAR
jgi:hypothetical protein